MAFDKYLFIEGLTSTNGSAAQSEALLKVEQLIDRNFQTERELEVEEIIRKAVRRLRDKWRSKPVSFGWKLQD